MKQIITLLTGTSPLVRDMFLQNNFEDMHDIMYFSDNINTAKHYSEGVILEIDIVLDMDKESDYIILHFDNPHANDDWDLSEYYFGSDLYKFPVDGTKLEDINKPENNYMATCYSINKNYLKDNCLAIRERN